MARPFKVDRDFLALNYRGLALAAFGSRETIQRLLGCDEWEAEAFQEQAASDYVDLAAKVRHETKSVK